MSSYMYSKTHSLTTRCGPNRTTTCTFHFEGDAPWGRNLTLMNSRNQPPNLTLHLPSNRRNWSRHHQTRRLSSRRTWRCSQYHQTRSWLGIHTRHASR